MMVPAVFAAVAAVLLYLGALHNPFTYDDYRLIVENPSLDDLSNIRHVLIRDITRPLVNLSYAVDTAVWGRAPYGYRLTNIALHACNVLLVFQVALLASRDRRRQRNQYLEMGASPPLAAFCAALLFAIHPMMTQAVAYISGRSEVAYGFFFLLAFLAGRQWMVAGGRRWWIACVSLWAAAVLTKETGAMLPFVLMAYNWLVLDAPPAERRRRLLAMGLPLMALTILAGLGRVAVLWFVEYGGVGVDRRYSLVAIDAFWRYLALFAVPRDQAIFHAMPMPDHGMPFRALAGTVGFLALPFAAWALRHAQSVMAFGAIWFILLLAPSSILFALGVGEPLAEHRAYLAAAGLFLVWGCAFDMFWQRMGGRTAMRWGLGVTAVLFAVQLSARTLERNVIWGDPVMLASEAVQLAPDHWFPRLLLAESLRQIGRCDRAVPEYRKSIQLRPPEEKTYIKLAGCLIEQRRLKEAEAAMLQLKSINPTSREASMTLGVLALLDNDPARGRILFAETVARHPDQVDAHRFLAFVDGTLPTDQHRTLCDELHAMVESFDTAACMARWRGGAVAPATPPPRPEH